MRGLTLGDPALVGALAPSEFSPFDISWQSAFWASDPDWSPPSDGGGVASWRNAGTSGAAATQETAGSQPIFRAADATFNGHPVIEFIDDALRSNCGVVAQPLTAVILLRSTDTTQNLNNYIWCSGATDTWLQRFNSATNLNYFSGAARVTSGSVSVGDPMLVVYYFNGASSTVTVNGVDRTSGAGSPGTNGINNMIIGSSSFMLSNFGKFLTPFMAWKSGSLTTPERSALGAWAASYYGITIAP